MSEMIAIKKVVLGERHLRPGRTRHTLVDNEGKRDFPPFISLVITQNPGEKSCYLMHLCENGQGADTWHESLDDALHQAEWEFDVRPEEWVDINEPF
jgi:hypothetical protein